MSKTKRRSMSVSATPPNLSQSETSTSISSSLWSNNKSTKSNFLSRFKTPNATSATIVTPSKSTSAKISASLPLIHGQQKSNRKPLKSGASTPTAAPRKKYEAILGIRSEDLIAEKKNNAKGFGNIFKTKKSTFTDKKINGENIHRTQNQQLHETLRPAGYGSNKINKDRVLSPPPPSQHTHPRPGQKLKITHMSSTPPVKTPIVNHCISDDKPLILANNHAYKPHYHHSKTSQPPPASSRSKTVNHQARHPPILQTFSPAPSEAGGWSTISTGKSTASYSLCSTFGPDSSDQNGNVNTAANTKLQLADNDSAHATDPVSIVANNEQTKNPAHLDTLENLNIEDSENDDDSSYQEEEDDNDNNNDVTKKDNAYSLNNQSDVLVDATGVSSEDLEREKIENRLSKRLSGGHFGSAGGLMISILTSSPNTQKRTSRPPPEDVVQSMMNWKRQSGQGSTKHATPDQQPTQQHVNEQQYDTTTVSVDDKDIPPPTPPEKDWQESDKSLPHPQRPLPPNPNILLPTTNKEAGLAEEEKEGIPIAAIVPGNSSKECASRLWEEDDSFVQRERIAEWLGQSKELNANTLNDYMNYFEFATMRLDTAFRKVCSKLYFRAEAQQIDRILEAFAKRYWQCNPKAIFGSADIVYAVVYSLLLLNTDLHVAQGNYTRMTRQEFVKNTMSTIKGQQETDPKWAAKKPNFMMTWEAQIEVYLKDMYISVKNYQILQPMQSSMDDTGLGPGDDNSFLTVSATTSNKRLSMMGGKRMNDIKRSLNTMINKTSSTRESMLFLDDPSPRKSSSSNTRQQCPTFPRRSKSVRSNRRDSFSSSHSNSSTLTPKTTISSNSSQLSPNPSHMMNFMDAHTADIFANRPPYLKEGVVMRKHLLESANQKAKHREWRECLLVVGQGELKMYGLQSENASDCNSISSRRNVLRASSTNFANLTGSLSKNAGSSSISSASMSSPNSTISYSSAAHNSSQRWISYSQLIGSIELNHSLSNALPPPGYNKSRSHVFAIQEPNGGVYLIQTTSNEQLVEWVSTCNYWAARQSKEPLQGGIGNLEYGWGSCLDDITLDSDAADSTAKYIPDSEIVTVSHWIPPAPTMVSSILHEKAQLEILQAYVKKLNEEINDHREIKRKIVLKFQQKEPNQTRAFSNWESRSKYLLHDIIKYQNYCDSLEKSIQSQETEGEDATKESHLTVANNW